MVVTQFESFILLPSWYRQQDPQFRCSIRAVFTTPFMSISSWLYAITRPTAHIYPIQVSVRSPLLVLWVCLVLYGQVHRP